MRHEVFALTDGLPGVARMNDWLEQAFDRAGLAPALRDDMKLCLNEAVANVLFHGDSGTAQKRVEIALALAPGRAEASVIDNCAPFDPLAHPVAAPITGLATAQVGGFGIALMRQTATRIGHVAAPGGGNRLTILCAAAPTDQPR